MSQASNPHMKQKSVSNLKKGTQVYLTGYNTRAVRYSHLKLGLQEVRQALKPILYTGQTVGLQLLCPTRDAMGPKKTFSQRIRWRTRHL